VAREAWSLRREEVCSSCEWCNQLKLRRGRGKRNSQYIAKNEAGLHLMSPVLSNTTLQTSTATLLQLSESWSWSFSTFPKLNISLAFSSNGSSILPLPLPYLDYPSHVNRKRVPHLYSVDSTWLLLQLLLPAAVVPDSE